jgi:glutamyl-tRNA reductase
MFHGIREDELAAWRHCLDPEAMRHLDEFSRRLVNRLLHLPISNLRRHAGLRQMGLASVVHELLTEEIPYDPESKGGDEPEGAPPPDE